MGNENIHKNIASGYKIETHVFNLLKEFNPINVAYLDNCDIQVSKFLIEVKGTELFCKTGKKQRGTYRIGRITIRINNHYSFKKYCDDNKFIPVYVICLKVNGDIVNFFCDYDLIDRFVKKNNRRVRCVSVVSILPKCKPFSKFIKELKEGER